MSSHDSHGKYVDSKALRLSPPGDVPADSHLEICLKKADILILDRKYQHIQY